VELILADRGSLHVITSCCTRHANILTSMWLNEGQRLKDIHITYTWMEAWWFRTHVVREPLNSCPDQRLAVAIHKYTSRPSLDNGQEKIHRHNNQNKSNNLFEYFQIYRLLATFPGILHKIPRRQNRSNQNYRSECFCFSRHSVFKYTIYIVFCIYTAKHTLKIRPVK
jgi:hypothetical protein